MATTVEEILVKFTGDASSLAKATDTSRLKTKDLEEEVLQLNRVLEHVQKTGKKPIHVDKAFESAEKAARNYRLELERLSTKEGGKGFGGGIGGGGGGGTNGLSVRGAFGLGAGIAAIRQGAILLTPAIEKLAKDMVGLTETFRNYHRELERGIEIERDRGRLMSAAESQRGREASLLRNPRTGAADVDAQKAFWEKEAEETKRKLDEVNNSIAVAEREVIRRDVTGRHIPGIGIGKQMEFEQAETNLKELRALKEHLKDQEQRQTGHAKDLGKEGTPLERLERQLKIEQESQRIRLESVGKTAEEVELIRQKEALHTAIRKGGVQEIEQLKKVEELLESMQDFDRKMESKRMKERLRQEGFKMAGRGFSGVEAEVLARNAEGKHEGNAEMLANAYTLEADALNQKYLPAAQKAQIEIDRLNMLKERGVLTSHAYEMAMRDVAKIMGDGDRRASPRQATLAGSAEHYGRMDEYARTMGQPAADKANLERAMKEDNPTVKAIKEGNAELKKIVNSLGKDKITFKPANVEN